MENILLISRVIISVIWVIFWLAVAIIYFKDKVAFKSAFSRLGKKVLSSIVQIIIFLIPFNILLWSNDLSVIRHYTFGLFIYISIFIGYLLLLIGATLSLGSIFKLNRILSLLESTNLDFRKNRNLIYISIILIAIGSSLAVMNASALLLAVLFIPYLIHRVKVENK